MPEQEQEKKQDPQLLTNSESTQNHHSGEFLVDWPVTDGDVGHLRESLQDSQFQRQIRLESLSYQPDQKMVRQFRMTKIGSSD